MTFGIARVSGLVSGENASTSQSIARIIKINMKDDTKDWLTAISIVMGVYGTVILLLYIAACFLL